MNAVGLLLLVMAAPPNLGDAAMQAGADRYLGVELGAEAGSPLTDPPATVPHGILRLRWIEQDLIPGPGLIDVDLNTDTLSAAYGHPGLLGPTTWAKVYVRGQAFAANLLGDHARGGVQVPERAFGAGYLLAGGHFGAQVWRGPRLQLYLAGQLEARQWLHFALPGTTSEQLVLPPMNQALEPSLFGLITAGETRTRLLRWHGVRAWSSATGIGRLAATPWGALGDDDDGRNQLGPIGGRLEAALEMGVVGAQLFWFRPLFEGGLRGGLGYGLDDRDRFRVGGDNPWVVPLSGAGWAEFLVDHYGWAGASAGVLIADTVTLDLGWDLVVINDPLREGAAMTSGAFGGAYLLAVLRPIDDVIIRAKASQGFGLPRPGQDSPLLNSAKVFVNVEWRILPWSWW